MENSKFEIRNSKDLARHARGLFKRRRDSGFLFRISNFEFRI